MNKEEIENILKKLKILNDEYCILGSASLVLRNIKKMDNDLDIAITEKGLEDLKARHYLTQEGSNYILIDASVNVEFLIRNKTDMSIEYCYSYPLQNIYQLLDSKKKRNLPKDQVDVKIIQNFLKKFKYCNYENKR